MIRCEECGRFVDRDDAHDAFLDDLQQHFWCSACCPICEVLNDDDEIEFT